MCVVHFRLLLIKIRFRNKKMPFADCKWHFDTRMTIHTEKVALILYNCIIALPQTLVNAETEKILAKANEKSYTYRK